MAHAWTDDGDDVAIVPRRVFVVRVCACARANVSPTAFHSRPVSAYLH